MTMTAHTATADPTLPLEEFADVAKVDQLRAALAEALDALEHPDRPLAAHRLRRLRRVAGRAEVPGDNVLTPTERAEEGIARAAAKWTDEEAALVEQAIRDVAACRVATLNSHLVEGAREFTTADVWAELGNRVPVTKGIAGKMNAAARAGVIVNTGRHAFNDNPDRSHAHGQRLTVWRAL